MNMLDQVLKALHKHERELRSSGVRALSIVGSVARGSARTDSDIDLAVKLDPDAHLGLHFFTLERRLSEMLERPVQLLVEPVESLRVRQGLDRDRRVVF